MYWPLRVPGPTARRSMHACPKKVSGREGSLPDGFWGDPTPGTRKGPSTPNHTPCHYMLYTPAPDPSGSCLVAGRVPGFTLFPYEQMTKTPGSRPAQAIICIKISHPEQRNAGCDAHGNEGPIRSLLHAGDLNSSTCQKLYYLPCPCITARPVPLSSMYRTPFCPSHLSSSSPTQSIQSNVLECHHRTITKPRYEGRQHHRTVTGSLFWFPHLPGWYTHHIRSSW